MENHGNGTADGLVFTADGPNTFTKTLKQLEKALVASGIRTMTFPSTGMAIESLLKKAKLQYTAEPINSDSFKGLMITVTAK
jgi:hypothetical protein